jgi:DNA polymerase I-like protein with 3'-5' exonuclease and polymerase domains
MLAHYMKDEEYTNEILNGDIHTKNQEAAGLPDRPKAKTFIYAFLYGAGDAKIGAIIGGSARKGQAIKERFLSQTPALARLQSEVKEASHKGWLQGLDGRKVWVRSEHAALNTLLQSAGAIVMKQALCILWRDLNRMKIPFGLCANVHDEWQIETPAPYANIVGQQAVVAIRNAGVLLKLRCPLDGEYKIGKTWKDTH